MAILVLSSSLIFDGFTSPRSQPFSIVIFLCSTSQLLTLLRPEVLTVRGLCRFWLRLAHRTALQFMWRLTFLLAQFRGSFG
jgi:hypothetical protein